MKKFWGYASNDNFSVGCTGQTVYLFDKNNTEIKKFKDIIYAYTPMISPDGKIFVVKSATGMLAVYSLETFSLIKKFRFSKVNAAQHDGFCFSPDGMYFINVERQIDDLHSAISIYNTVDFSRVDQIMLCEDMVLSHIEFDKITNTYFVLGFIRGTNTGYIQFFVAKFEDSQIKDITSIYENEYNFYDSYKNLEIHGFTQKKFEWSYINCELDELKSSNHSLKELYIRHRK